MRWTSIGSIAVAFGLAAGGADAQSWPDRPVHIVVPLTAGSATDVMARIVARQLSQQLGQPFIVENKPGTLNYGSAGVGTANQLNAERFRTGAGIDAVHVPFKGTPEVLNDVLAGRVDYFFCPVNVCVPMIREKRLLALAMGSGKRSAALPDLPTTLELGVPNSDYDFWVGLFMPSGTPREILDKIYAETARAIEGPELRQGMAQLGAEANIIEPDAYNRQLRREIVDNAALVKAAGVPIGGAQ